MKTTYKELPVGAKFTYAKSETVFVKRSDLPFGSYELDEKWNVAAFFYPDDEVSCIEPESKKP